MVISQWLAKRLYHRDTAEGRKSCPVSASTYPPTQLTDQLPDLLLADPTQPQCTVCEGYANLAVAMNRSYGIPACYISGNLTTNSGQTGLHAWLSTKLDGNWLLQDPTNLDSQAWAGGLIEIGTTRPSFEGFDAYIKTSGKYQVDSKAMESTKALFDSCP